MTSDELRAYHREDWQVEIDTLRSKIKELEAELARVKANCECVDMEGYNLEAGRACLKHDWSGPFVYYNDGFSRTETCASCGTLRVSVGKDSL